MSKQDAPVRPARISGEIVRILGTALERQYRSELTGLVSIAQVDIGRDLKQAKVYFSVFGTPADVRTAKQFFRTRAGQLRSLLASQLRIRSVPELLFEYDETGARAARVEELLAKIEQERAERADDIQSDAAGD